MRLTRLAPGGSAASDLGIRPGVFTGRGLPSTQVSSWLNRRAGFSPIAASFGWNNAYWAEDPAWANPGDGGAVTSWRDAGSEGIDITDGGTSTRRPTFRTSVAALNNRPALEFDGTSDNLQGSSAPTGSGTVTAVFIGNCRTANVTSNMNLIGTGSGASDVLLDIAATNDVFRIVATSSLTNGAVDCVTIGHIVTAVASNGAGTASIKQDNATPVTGDTGTTGLGNVRTVGANTARSGSFAHINAAFIGVKLGTLTAEQTAALIAWSQSYYATP